MMRRHINWIKERLISVHSDRIAVAADLTTGSIPVTEDDLATIARSEGRASLVPHLRNVLEEGMRRASFWASPSSDYSRSGWQAYPIPSQSEVQSFMDALANKTMILFPQDPGDVVLDRDSVVNRLDFIGIAEYGDGFRHLPTIAFKDALWPHVARAFKGPKWQFYRHRAGMVALSTKADAEELLVSLIDSSIRERYQGITVDMDVDLFPFQAPALVSGKDKKGRALDRYDARSATTRWMQVHKDDIPWDEYRKLPTTKRTYSWETTDVITEDALYKYAERDSRAMASILRHPINKFW